jgi:NADH dehydrogenase
LSSPGTSPRHRQEHRRRPGFGRRRRYRRRDLGLFADLGGTAAVARPLGIPLSGPVAKVVTKAYHLYAVPAAANRLRIAAAWAVDL